MTDSARLPVPAPAVVVDGEVLPDGVLDEDRHIAEIGRQHRESGRNPNAVTDPRHVAEIRRRIAFYRQPWYRRWFRRAAQAGDVAAGVGIYCSAFIALCQVSTWGWV